MRCSTRRRTGPTSHAVFDPPPDRPDPVSLLEQQAESRLPELVPVRYGRMMVSPFTYYRGAALPMASDLAATPVTGLAVQACGDAHLSNFGVFGSAERRLVFDVNDFDETLPGPWEWDVKRLAASLEVAARDNGFADNRRREIVTATMASYREAMRSFAKMTNLDVWYARADMDQLQLGSQLNLRQRKMVDKGMTKARTRDSMQEVAKLTQQVNGRPRIISDPPLLVPIDELIPEQVGRTAFESQLAELIARYRRTLETDRRYLLEQFEFCDMARKVVGVGSVGTRCWIVLLLGRDDSDPLFLQVKEAEASVLSRFAGASKTSSSAGSGSRPGWTARPATSTSANCATGNSPWTSRPWCRAACGYTASCAGGRWRGRTPGPATASRSLPTWAARTSSTRRSPSSRTPTPTRTNVTTKPWWLRPRRDGSSQSATCEIRLTARGPGRSGG